MNLKVTLRRSGTKNQPAFFFVWDDGKTKLLSPRWSSKAKMKQWLISMVKAIQADAFDVYDEEKDRRRPQSLDSTDTRVLWEGKDGNQSSVISAARTLLALYPVNVELHLRNGSQAGLAVIRQLLVDAGGSGRFKIIYDVSPAVRGR